MRKLTLESDILVLEIMSVKERRVGLDGELQKLKAMKASRERALAITKTQEAIMWLGMDLKRINEARPQEQRAPNPYPESYNPANAKVEPTADGLKL